jgi:hypothetical protein
MAGAILTKRQDVTVIVSFKSKTTRDLLTFSDIFTARGVVIYSCLDLEIT